MAKKKSDAAAEQVANYIENEMKKQMVPLMAKGGAIFATTVSEMIENGATLEEVKSLCDSMVKAKDIIK